MKRILSAMLVAAAGSWLLITGMITKILRYLVEAVFLPAVYGLDGGTVVQSIQTALMAFSDVVGFLDKAVDMGIVIPAWLALWSFDVATQWLCVQRVMVRKLYDMIADVLVPL